MSDIKSARARLKKREQEIRQSQDMTASTLIQEWKAIRSGGYSDRALNDLIDETIAALSPVLPDEVDRILQRQIEMRETATFRDVDLRESETLIERLAQQIEWHDKNAAAWKADAEAAQARIDELENEVEALEFREKHFKERSKND